MVRKRLAKAQSVKSRSFEFTLDNRLLKLGLRGNKSVMITRPVASRLPFSLSLILLGSFFFTTLASGKPHRYAGRPFEDSVYHGGPQLMPGRALCAYCDLGGEGVVYHDSDAKNNSSGSLHPADGTYLNQLHVGWVGPGEWFNMAVRVERSGVHASDLLYTSSAGGDIAFDVNGKRDWGPVTITST